MKQSNNLLHIKLYIKKVGQLHITRRHTRRSLRSLRASAHFHLLYATVKTSHTPGTLYEMPRISKRLK